MAVGLGGAASPATISLLDDMKTGTKINASDPQTVELWRRALDRNSLEMISSSELKGMHEFTKGRMGVLYRAKFKDVDVVVKLPRLDMKATAEDCVIAVSREINVLRCLSHPNIITLIGAGYTTAKVPFFVTERINGKTLDVLLGTKLDPRQIKGKLKPPKFETDIYKFAAHLARVLPLARQLAGALRFIQSDAVEDILFMHRDLKPDNILVTTTEEGKEHVKLIDFGLSRAIPVASLTTGERYLMTAKTGSLRYMAPESACGKAYNGSTDVYSYSLILWEVIALHKPYGNLKMEDINAVFGSEQLRPPLPQPDESAWSTNLLKLLEEGWAHRASKRPSFDTIITTLDAMILEASEVLASAPLSSADKKDSGFLSRPTSVDLRPDGGSRMSEDGTASSGCNCIIS